MITLLSTDLFPQFPVCLVTRLVTRLLLRRLINAAASCPLRIPPTHLLLQLFSEHAEQPMVSGTDGTDGLGGKMTLVHLFVATVSPARALASILD